MLPINQIDKTWTLFLDRDGVINYEKHKDYIHTWDEFKFYEGVPAVFKIFSKKFHRVIIVTNQKDCVHAEVASKLHITDGIAHHDRFCKINIRKLFCSL